MRMPTKASYYTNAMTLVNPRRERYPCTRILTQHIWTYDSDTKRMAQRDVKYVPGFFKIVDEILVNAADNKVFRPDVLPHELAHHLRRLTTPKWTRSKLKSTWRMGQSPFTTMVAAFPSRSTQRRRYIFLNSSSAIYYPLQIMMMTKRSSLVVETAMARSLPTSIRPNSPSTPQIKARARSTSKPGPTT